MDTSPARTTPNAPLPRVVIVGGGFGGLRAAQRLAGARCEVTLIDKRNHHVFQPLLYQVATAGLSPADIAAPIRRVLRRQRNATVVLDEVVRVDVHGRIVHGRNGTYAYDYLVLAAGATHTWFGNDAWAPLAPGLKTLDDALEIRRRVLVAFEEAELEADDDARRAALTFVVVGGGPTGVELAGALREIAAETIPRDFRRVDTSTARIILVEGQDRLLPSMSQTAGERARRDLEAMGVEVRLNAFVTDVQEDAVSLGDDRIASRTVLWAAGVRAAELNDTLGAPQDRAGRVEVEADCSVPGYRNVFVVGDAAKLSDPTSGEPVPGVAQGALQMGAYVAGIIRRELRGDAAARAPFRYNDKGAMATIGRAKAVVDLGERSFGGFVAWVLWSAIHVAFLIEFRNRVMVMLQWLWAWVAQTRGARLITGDVRAELEAPADDANAVVDGGAALADDPVATSAP